MRTLLISVDGLSADHFAAYRSTMPTIDRLDREGISLRCQAVAPSVTWPGHATIITGVTPARHGAAGNLLWDRHAGVVRQLYLERDWHGTQFLVPTLFGEIRNRGGLTAALSWPSARGLADYCIVDTDDSRVILAEASTELLQAVEQPVQRLCAPGEGDGLDIFLRRDALLARIAGQLSRKRRVDLVAVQLSSVDFSLHHFGEGSVEHATACAAVDREVARIMDNLPDDCAVVITGDHGHAAVSSKAFPNEDLARAGVLSRSGEPGALVVGNGGSGWLYGIGPDPDTTAGEAAAVLREVGYRVEKPLAFDPTASEPMAPWVGDYLVEAGPEAVIANGVHQGEGRQAGMLSSHGHLPDHPAMDAHAVVWGAGTAPQQQASLLDLAPTIADLLGLPFNAMGRSRLA
jgi:predicted AlkP superfamily pyrophosphatase or phosphodiesterase